MIYEQPKPDIPLRFVIAWMLLFFGIAALGEMMHNNAGILFVLFLFGVWVGVAIAVLLVVGYYQRKIEKIKGDASFGNMIARDDR